MTLTVLATISEVSGMRELLQQGVGDIATESNSSVGEASSGLIGNYEDIWAQYETSEKKISYPDK